MSSLQLDVNLVLSLSHKTQKDKYMWMAFPLKRWITIFWLSLSPVWKRREYVPVESFQI